MNHVEKTLELVARVMRLQKMALQGERYHINYSGNVDALSFWKSTGDPGENFVVNFSLIHYFDTEDIGDTLEEIEAKIKEEEDKHRDII